MIAIGVIGVGLLAGILLVNLCTWSRVKEGMDLLERIERFPMEELTQIVEEWRDEWRMGKHLKG